jgi:L-aspartate oxidase
VSDAPLVSRVGAEVRYSSYDVLVIGGGIAGLTAAVGAAHRWNVGLITKGTLDQTTTFLAQGGIAAALGPYDSPELHLKDTLIAGVGLCDEEAVRVLVQEGPARVRELEQLGTKFDRRDGKLILGSEGAHSVPRVVHAGGDATGSVVGRARGGPLHTLSPRAAGWRCTRTSSSSTCSWTQGGA